MHNLTHATGQRHEIRGDLHLPGDSAECSFRLLMGSLVRHFRILLGTIIAEALILAALLAKGFHWF